MNPGPEYSLPELCEVAQVTPRTVRYYIRQGLLRSPGTTGPRARYDQGHLNRLHLIKRLQRSHLPLAEIRSRLAALSNEEVGVALSQNPEPPSDSAIDYVRWVLASKGVAPPVARLSEPSLTLRSRTLAYGGEADAHALPEAPEGAAVPSQAEAVSPGQITLSEGEGSAPRDPSVQPSAHRLTPAQSDRSIWERIVVSPDIELHVRRPLSRLQNRSLGRLIDFAHKLFQEDQP